MSFEWTVQVRDPQRQIQGVVEDYTSLQVTPKWNDVGTWTLKIDRRAAQAANLQTPGWGIVLLRDDTTVVMSGSMASATHTVSQSEQTLTVTGYDDNVVLARRQASPSPAESGPPYTANAEDVIVGTASAVLAHYVHVNAGLGAITPRRVPGLDLDTIPALGPSITGRARWQMLLPFLQGLVPASGGLGFRIVQVGTSLRFQVYQPTDRTSTAMFSFDLGNLTGYSYGRTAPTSNYSFVGGSGSGTARVMSESQDSASIATWGRIEGELVDSSTSASTAELQQAGAAALTEGAEKSTLSISPIDTPRLAYLQDYFLGDKVTVQLEGSAARPANNQGLIQDVVRSVEINLTPGGPQTVTPSIGTQNATPTAQLFAAFKGLRRRVVNLERR